MKKTLLFLLLCLSVSLFSRADNDLPSNYMGYAVFYTGYTGSAVGFTLPEGKTSMYVIDSDFDAGGNFKWGTWAEDTYVGAWKYGEEGAEYFLFKSYNPATKEWAMIGGGDGKITSLSWDIQNDVYDMTYDYVSEKVYIVSQGKLYSNDLTNTTFTEIGTLTDGLEASSIACNQAGELYVVYQEGGPAYFETAAKLYKVDKTTAAATYVGDLGINLAYFEQAATFDYHTDVLYFVGTPNNISFNTYTIDITTGTATVLSSMSNAGLSGMASVFYTKNVPPGKATDLTLALDENDSNKVNLSFAIPAIDFNGETSNSASKAVVYRQNDLGVFIEEETIDPITPGNTVSKQYTLPGEGTFIYAVEIFTAAGISSGKVSAEIINVSPIALPYLENFTNPSPNIAFTLADAGSVYFSPDNGIDNSASLAFKKGAVTNKMEISSIPFVKGAAYGISFYAKTTKESQDVLRYMINNESNWTYLNVPSGGNFSKHTLTPYIAAANQDGIFTLYKNAITDTEIIYVDDLQIEMLSPPTAPGRSTFGTITAAPLGAMEASVTVTTPTLDMAGNPLSGLTGIRIEYATDASKTANYGMQDFSFTGIGEQTTLTVPITTSAGRYYFFVSARNNDDYCYDIVRSSSPVYIGEETTPGTPVNEKLFNEEGGKIKMTWDPVTTGTNGGYIEEDKVSYSVTYYGGDILSRVPEIIYDISEAEYITSSLPVGVYTFTVKAHYKMTPGFESSQTQILNKDRDEQQIIAEATGTAWNYAGYPFVSYYDYSSSNASGLSQMTYSVEEMGGAMYIDSLYLFTQQSSYRTEVSQTYRISLGYKDELLFANNTDFVSKDRLQVVFDGSITFDNTTTIISIPIEGFYYDGTKPLLVQMEKTLNGRAEIDTYVKDKNKDESALGNRGIIAKSNSVDLTEINDTADYPNTSLQQSIPSFVVVKELNIATLSGVVTSEETGDLMENVSLVIASVAGENEKPLNVEVFTNPDGEYMFAILPFNEYILTVSAPGYVDFIHEFTVDEMEDLELYVELEGANKIKVEGLVKNLNNDLLEGVEVIISRTEELDRMITVADGAFEFDVYGSTTYTMTFSKAGMTTLTQQVTVLDEDMTLEAVVMHYQIVPVPSVTASLNGDGSATVAWTATNPVPVNGYRIYRGTADQTFDQYTLLTATSVTGVSYTDTSLTGIEYGVFKYAVCTDWYGDDLSAPVYSEEIEKNMYVNVTVDVNTNGASAQGASLTLSNNNYTYSATANATGKATFEDVRRVQTYSLVITLEYHNTVTMTGIEVNAGINIESDVLEEITAVPVIGETNSIENIIEINWSIAATVNPIGFKVYLDNELKEELEVSVLNYIYRGVEAGDRVVGVKAVFASGDSEMAVKTINVEGLVRPINLNVKVTENDAELTWSPGGFSDPLKYEVYLNGELMRDDVTENKYLFEDLANGDYRAGVVAVYENGKSDAAERTFTISYVNIENISSSIAAYPNPTTNGRFTMELTADSSVKIYNANGVLLMNKGMLAGKHDMDLSAQQRGIYFIQIASPEATKTIKIIYNK